MVSVRLNKNSFFLLGIIAFILFVFYFGSQYDIQPLRGPVVNVKDLLKTCIFLSENAGNSIKAKYRNRLDVMKKKTDIGPKNEVLTELDLTSHNVITSGLKKIFPEINVISEEHPAMDASKEAPVVVGYHSDFVVNLPASELIVPSDSVTLWVDPLDATQELTEGLLEYVTVMICVAVEGYPIAGVIHQPFLNNTYWAWKNRAQSPTLSSLNKSKSSGSDELTITHSRSHLSDEQLKRVRDIFSPTKVKTLPAGGSGYKSLSLLKAQADLYVHPAKTRKWDVCAPHAILESMGGRMTGLDGSVLTYGAKDQPGIPENVGLLAASDKKLHEKWASKLSGIAPTGN